MHLSKVFINLNKIKNINKNIHELISMMYACVFIFYFQNALY